MALRLDDLSKEYSLLFSDDDHVLADYKGLLVFAQDECGFNRSLVHYNGGTHAVLYRWSDESAEMVIDKYSELSDTPFFPEEFGARSPSFDPLCLAGTDLYDALFIIADDLFGIRSLMKHWRIDMDMYEATGHPGTNIEQFNELMQLGLYSELEAAALTFSGMNAARHGFRPVRVLDREHRSDACRYDMIKILFER